MFLFESNENLISKTVSKLLPLVISSLPGGKSFINCVERRRCLGLRGSWFFGFEIRQDLANKADEAINRIKMPRPATVHVLDPTLEMISRCFVTELEYKCSSHVRQSTQVEGKMS